MKFSSWLQTQLIKRGWDQSEVAKRAQMTGYYISKTQVSRIINGDRQAGPDACIAIAHALGLSREEVFKARGWLLTASEDPVQPNMTPQVAEVIRQLLRLPQDTQELVVYPLKAQLDTIIKALERPATSTPSPTSRLKA